MDTAPFQRMLEAQRADIANTLGAISERLRSSQGESGGELSLADQHPADAATETEEREMDLARHQLFEAHLARIDAALARITKGTYGTCRACGQQIPWERLEVIPDTPYCVRDAAKEER